MVLYIDILPSLNGNIMFITAMDIILPVKQQHYLLKNENVCSIRRRTNLHVLCNPLHNEGE